MSPSAIGTYDESVEEFFLRYVVRVPRPPQSQAMAAGSAFDACCKAYILVNCCGFDTVSKVQYEVDQCNERLHVKLEKYGNVFEPVEYDGEKSLHMNMYQCLLTESVEEHNLTWSEDVGKRIFIDYKSCGALDNLLDDAVDIRPVDELTAVVRSDSDVPLMLLGKPDLVYKSKRFDQLIVDDWKCNGYVAKRTVSPTPGYVDMFPSRAMHKKCELEPGGGPAVNTLPMPSVYELQLHVYGYIVGADIVGISQLVFDKNSQLRVAKHRYRCSSRITQNILCRAQSIWDKLLAYHADPMGGFDTLSKERCLQLAAQGDVLRDPLSASLVGRG